MFVTGSVICTFAQSSKLFIVGRAVCGLGVGAIDNSTIALITHLFPRHKRSSWLSWSGTAQAVGLSCAPVVGGALIGRFGWRACFGINLPLCPLLIVFTVLFLEDPIANPNYALPIAQKLRMVDLPGTLLIVPSVTCLLMALQLGSIQYGWSNGRTIALFIVFLIFALSFVYWQHRLGDKASIPSRIIKKRSILAAAWFSACCNGIIAMIEFYISVYWQGVRNETAFKSGLLSLGLIIGLFAGSMLSGFGIPKVGYFTRKLLPLVVLSSLSLRQCH
jgi:MFS family permease